jgi:hypothetical protein
VGWCFYMDCGALRSKGGKKVRVCPTCWMTNSHDL